MTGDPGGTHRVRNAREGWGVRGPNPSTPLGGRLWASYAYSRLLRPKDGGDQLPPPRTPQGVWGAAPRWACRDTGLGRASAPSGSSRSRTFCGITTVLPKRATQSVLLTCPHLPCSTRTPCPTCSLASTTDDLSTPDSTSAIPPNPTYSNLCHPSRSSAFATTPTSLLDPDSNTTCLTPFMFTPNP